MSLFPVSSCFRHTTWLSSEGGFAGVGNYTLSSNDMHCSCDFEDAIVPQVCNIDNRNCMLHLCDSLLLAILC